MKYGYVTLYHYDEIMSVFDIFILKSLKYFFFY